jgi:hypothetical protein
VVSAARDPVAGEIRRRDHAIIGGCLIAMLPGNLRFSLPDRPAVRRVRKTGAPAPVMRTQSMASFED